MCLLNKSRLCYVLFFFPKLYKQEQQQKMLKIKFEDQFILVNMPQLSNYCYSCGFNPSKSCYVPIPHIAFRALLSDRCTGWHLWVIRVSGVSRGSEMIRSMTLRPVLSRVSAGSVPGLSQSSHPSWTSFGHHGEHQRAVELRPSFSIHPRSGGDCGAHRLPSVWLQHPVFPHVHQHCAVSF